MTTMTAAVPYGMAEHWVAAALMRAFQTETLRPEGYAGAAELIQAGGLDGWLRKSELRRMLSLNWGIAPVPERDDFDLKDLHRVLCEPFVLSKIAPPPYVSEYQVAVALHDAFRRSELRAEGRARPAEIIRAAALDGWIQEENLVDILGTRWEIAGCHYGYDLESLHDFLSDALDLEEA